MFFMKIILFAICFLIPMTNPSIQAKDPAALTIMGMPDSCGPWPMISFWDHDNDKYYETCYLYNCENKPTRYDAEDKDKILLINGLLANLDYGNIDSNNWHFTVTNPNTKDTIAYIEYDQNRDIVVLQRTKTTSLNMIQNAENDFKYYVSDEIITIFNENEIFIKNMILYDLSGIKISEEIIQSNQKTIRLPVQIKNRLIIIMIVTVDGYVCLKIIV